MLASFSVRIQTSVLLAFASAVALVSVHGCATNRPALTAANRNPAADPVVCKNVAELADLETALDDVPDLAASSQVSSLLVDQERLGSAKVAIGAFAATGVSAPIRPQVEAFAQQLTTAVAALEAATTHLDQTAVAVRAVALEAAVCHNVHIASLRRITSAQGQLEAQYAPALTADERREAQAVLQNKACAPQIRGVAGRRDQSCLQRFLARHHRAGKGALAERPNA
jgi:hypothetical protein